MGSEAGLPRPLEIELLFPRDGPELVHDAHVQLPHALLGDPQLLPDLFQCHVFRVIQARPHPDDLPLARIEVFPQPIDRVT